MKEGVLTICAGGSSIKRFVKQIGEKQKYEDAYILAINDTHDFLVENGIIAESFVILGKDIEPKAIDYGVALGFREFEMYDADGYRKKYVA